MIPSRSISALTRAAFALTINYQDRVLGPAISAQRRAAD
jgi:hypothetical protein